MTNVRVLASSILKQVLFEGAFINQELKKVTHLSDADMGLLTNVVYGTTKNYLAIEHAIRTHVPLNKNKRIVRALLASTVYMSYFLEKIPEYAIINEAVESAKKLTNDYTAKFINSVLRTKLESINKSLRELMSTTSDGIEELARKESVPAWVMAMIAKQYSIEEAAFFFHQMKKPARQFARVNRMQTSRDKIMADTQAFSIVKGIPSAIELENGNISKTEEYKKGYITVQNISSQCVGVKLEPREDEKIWDMCASPGGKTTHIAELMHDQGAITATDFYEHRIELIRWQASRLGITNITALQADATTYLGEEPFDRILLDAPCSGLGVLRQKPEIVLHITPESIDEIQQTQSELLENADRNLKIGGTLLYSTCTINKKENEKQVAAFLEGHPNYLLKEEKTYFEEIVDGFTGFYYAILIKNKKNES